MVEAGWAESLIPNDTYLRHVHISDILSGSDEPTRLIMNII